MNQCVDKGVRHNVLLVLSGVPPGRNRHVRNRIPSNELLGYCQASLRDGCVTARPAAVIGYRSDRPCRNTAGKPARYTEPRQQRAACETNP